MDKPVKIPADITIMAMYTDEIVIKVKDRKSGISFLEMTLTKEQFVNAAMNRLGNCDVAKAEVRGLDKVGKTLVQDVFAFPLPKGSVCRDKDMAVREVKKVCPAGWEPELYFGAQDSFFTKDGKEWARTQIRKWV